MASRHRPETCPRGMWCEQTGATAAQQESCRRGRYAGARLYRKRTTKREIRQDCSSTASDQVALNQALASGVGTCPNVNFCKKRNTGTEATLPRLPQRGSDARARQGHQSYPRGNPEIIERDDAPEAARIEGLKVTRRFAASIRIPSIRKPERTKKRSTPDQPRLKKRWTLPSSVPVSPVLY